MTPTVLLLSSYEPIFRFNKKTSNVFSFQRLWNTEKFLHNNRVHQLDELQFRKELEAFLFHFDIFSYKLKKILSIHASELVTDVFRKWRNTEKCRLKFWTHLHMILHAIATTYTRQDAYEHCAMHSLLSWHRTIFAIFCTCIQHVLLYIQYSDQQCFGVWFTVRFWFDRITMFLIPFYAAHWSEQMV